MASIALLVALGLCALLALGAFALASWREGQPRAARIALLLGLGGRWPSSWPRSCQRPDAGSSWA
ncbi:MAG: hypothetical protein P8129_24720 [Anaerolineae bacterium]